MEADMCVGCEQKFDDICYHGSESNNMACDMNVGGG